MGEVLAVYFAGFLLLLVFLVLGELQLICCNERTITDFHYVK